MKRRARIAPSFFVPALSALHMLGLLLARRDGTWGEWAAYWAVSAFCVPFFLLARDVFASGRGDRSPDLRTALAWGAAGALEFQTIHPMLSDTHIVPAVLFPFFAWHLSARRSAVYGAVSLLWLLFSPDGVLPEPGRVLSVLGISTSGFVAVRMARRGTGGKPEERELVRDAIEQTRSMLLPREKQAGNGTSGSVETLGRLRLLRSREYLMEGVRRILEGVLPITGADVVLFVSPSFGTGRSYRAGASAFRSGKPFAGDPTIPENYIPVEEAMILHRPFFAEGEAARAFGIGGEAGNESPSGVACAPVAFEGRVEGAVLAMRYGGDRWREPATHLLEMAAFLVAREVERAKRQYEADGYDAQLWNLVQKIAEIAESGGAKDLPPRTEVCRASTEQARRQLDAARAFLVETKKEGGKGRIAWESTETVSREHEEWIGLEGTYLEWVQKQGVHRIFPSERTGSARFDVLPKAWHADGVGCRLLFPVPSLGGFRGVMVCESGSERGFDAQDAKTVRNILDVMKMGISHALYVEELEKQATNDGLTGLLNRKTFQNRLTSVLSRLDGRYPCVVAMLDIDHFKRINDVHGHPAGDEVLRKISGIIRKTVRKADMAGRYGGEEFILYLYDTDESRAFMVAERLRMKIRETRFLFDGKEIGATASLGIACYPVHGKDCESLIKHADTALYASKQAGRDRTTIHLKH